jgi:hypothetical protein
MGIGSVGVSARLRGEVARERGPMCAGSRPARSVILRRGATSPTTRSPRFVRKAVVACCVCFLAACGGGGSSTTSTVTTRAVTPMGTILAVHYGGIDSATGLYEGEPSIAYRDDPSVSHGFRHFGVAGPRGDPTCCNGEVYGVSEAWIRTPAGPVVVRAQAHPARRPAFGDFKASAWSFRAQDATGTWSPAFGRGSANRGLNEDDDQEAGGKTVPRLMTVGNANPQMFACAGGRSEDNAVRTTVLDEVKPPTGAPPTGGSVRFIQDLADQRPCDSSDADDHEPPRESRHPGLSAVRDDAVRGRCDDA